MKSIIKMSILVSLATFTVHGAIEDKKTEEAKKDIISSLVDAHKKERIEKTKADRLARRKARIDRKKRRQKARREIHEDIKNIPKNISESINERRNRKKFFREKRQTIRDYVAKQTKKEGARFELANKIAKVSAEMMEKHFAGKASIVAGSLCLKKMQENKDSQENLTQLYKDCNEQLLDFKKQAKKKNIEYEDVLEPATKRELIGFLNQTFPQNEKLVTFLRRSFRSTMICSVRGAAISGSYLFGAGIGAYYFKCESKLGRRVLFGSGDLTVNMGLGGVFSTANPRFKRNQDGTYSETTMKEISYYSLRKSSLAPAGRIDCGFGLAVDGIETPTMDKTNEGIGLGMNVGAGGSKLFKIKDLTTNFKTLFELLKMGFDQDTKSLTTDDL